MRLTEITEKIKTFPDLPKDIFVLMVIFLVGVGAYILGREGALSERRESQLQIVSNINTDAGTARNGENVVAEKGGVVPNVQNVAVDGMYVGSRSGTTFHLPWCAGAQRIKEENKIWFKSKEEAIAKGYKPATNCKGI